MYTPLYVKTNYSLLSSMNKIQDIIEYGKKNNLKNLVICDSSMYGVMEFYHASKNNKINPIVGLEVIIDNNKVLLFAKNYNGYLNLINLSTIQSQRMLTIDDLMNYSNDLVCIVLYFYRAFYEEIKNIILDSYIGFSNKEEENDARCITSNCVFCPKILYPTIKEKEYLKYLLMIKDGKTVSDENYDIEDDAFPLYLDNIDNYSSSDGILKIDEIVSKCFLKLPNYPLRLPIYKVDKNVDSASYLMELSKKGLIRRLDGNVTKPYQERLMYELSVIEKMGFSNYFLVVYDFIKYAKKNKILVGPGRGSAAGSLVSYTLGITDIDPLKYNLLFERFLNPERISMPDIDTDFPDIYRDQIISYVISKYGMKNVAGIITFGTLGSKQAIRDVSRVLNIPLIKVDTLCNLIPFMSNKKLNDFYLENEKFKMMIDSDMQLNKMFKIAKIIEGFPRHTSSHAAGIVMSEDELTNVIPLTKSTDMYLTSYPMEYLEQLGLLKMDFLGLKNLTTIMNIISDIEKNTGVAIDFSKIPMDDAGAIEIFTKAETSGIFQFESSGMRNFLKKLKPTSFEDITSAIALFRPGPANNIDSYIRRKHGKEPITYPCYELKPILENTYGILIYQEQIMQTAKIMADYTLGEADILRRAMSKKKMDVLKAEEERFVNQSVKKGYTKEKAKEVFDLILHFANYGFNRAHSVAYSVIAYKMAYLKSKYPTYFFSNLLSSVIGSEAKTKEYINEIKSLNLNILKPDINLSDSMYMVVDDGILFPLSNIKGVGSVATKAIIESRKNDKFHDIFDAMSRLVIAGVSKKTIESLIYADAFSSFGYNKNTLIFNLDELLNYAELTKDLDPSFVIKPEIEIVSEFSQNYLLEKEKEIFGFYLSNHPVSSYRSIYINAIFLNELEKYFNKIIEVIVMIDQIKVINTKKGDKMAFLLASDETTTVDFTLFPNVYLNNMDLSKGMLVKILGKVERRMDKMQIIVQKIENINHKENIQ